MIWLLISNAVLPVELHLCLQKELHFAAVGPQTAVSWGAGQRDLENRAVWGGVWGGRRSPRLQRLVGGTSEGVSRPSSTPTPV